MFLCSIEGLDASGKTTQCKLLADALKGDYPLVHSTKAIGGTYVGAKIRQLVCNEQDLNQKELFLLFQADRAYHVRELKEKYFDHIVIFDRYYDSTFAYQYDIPDIYHLILKNFVTEGLNPDVTFLIDVPTEVALERMKARESNDFLDKTSKAFYDKVRERFLYLYHHENHDNRISLIDGTQSIEDIHSYINYTVRSELEKEGNLN